MLAKYHVKKGDKVVVNSGSWKGEAAKITAVLREKDRVVLELSEMTPQKRERIGMRTVRKTQKNPKGTRIERAISVHVSNVTLVQDGKQDKKEAQD